MERTSCGGSELRSTKRIATMQSSWTHKCPELGEHQRTSQFSYWQESIQYCSMDGYDRTWLRFRKALRWRVIDYLKVHCATTHQCLLLGLYVCVLPQQVFQNAFRYLIRSEMERCLTFANTRSYNWFLWYFEQREQLSTRSCHQVSRRAVAVGRKKWCPVVLLVAQMLFPCLWANYFIRRFLYICSPAGVFKQRNCFFGNTGLLFVLRTQVTLCIGCSFLRCWDFGITRICVVARDFILWWWF